MNMYRNKILFIKNKIKNVLKKVATNWKETIKCLTSDEKVKET